jgi:hypothetical protein
MFLGIKKSGQNKLSAGKTEQNRTESAVMTWTQNTNRKSEKKRSNSKGSTKGNKASKLSFKRLFIAY